MFQKRLFARNFYVSREIRVQSDDFILPWFQKGDKKATWFPGMFGQRATLINKPTEMLKAATGINLLEAIWIPSVLTPLTKLTWIIFSLLWMLYYSLRHQTADPGRFLRIRYQIMLGTAFSKVAFLPSPAPCSPGRPSTHPLLWTKIFWGDQKIWSGTTCYAGGIVHWTTGLIVAEICL